MSQNMSNNTNSNLLLKIMYSKLAILWNFKEPPNNIGQDLKHSPNTSLLTTSQCVEEINNKNHHWRCSRHIIFLQFKSPPKYPKPFYTCKLSKAQQSGLFCERPQGCKGLTLPLMQWTIYLDTNRAQTWSLGANDLRHHGLLLDFHPIAHHADL